MIGEVLRTHRAPSETALEEVVDQVFLPLSAHYGDGSGRLNSVCARE